MLNFNKKTLYKILTPIGMIILSICIYAYACYVFNPKTKTDLGANAYTHGREYVNEKQNSFDVMFFGDSNVRLGVIPARLKDKYDIYSYNCGINGQVISNIGRRIKHASKYQNLKVVIIDVNCINTIDFGKLNENFMYVTSPFIFGVKWKKFKAHDFFGKSNLKTGIDVDKGYVYSNIIHKYDHIGDYMNINKDFNKFYAWKNLKKLQKIIADCQKKNVKVILTQIPTLEWSAKKSAKIKIIADKYQIPFIDYNYETKAKFGLDLKTSFCDNGIHLNTFGAIKITDHIGAYLKTNYSDVISKNLTDDSQNWTRVINNYKTRISQYKISAA